MASFNLLLIAVTFAFGISPLHACGIAVHNEVTYRSIENFIPKTNIQQLYKDDMIKSASFSQAGSFFPDWGYQCLGYNQQSEDAHWPTFIKTAVNYIRETYPVSQFHNDEHVQGLISFVFAIMSHGMADVKWHSLSGLSDYFVVAMANMNFHGNTQEAHMAADTGAEFTLRHSNKLSYLNETWQVPIKDMIEVYRRLYATEGNEDKRIPLSEHLQYCMTAAFAASKVDVAFGQLMFGYYGSKSPFLTEELYDYYKGGIQDMAAGVTDCYPELVDAFEYGSTHTTPDTLCTNYFYTTLPSTLHGQPKCLIHKKKAGHHVNRVQSQRSDNGDDYNYYSTYDSVKGVLTITADVYKQKQKHQDDDLLPSVIVQPQTKSHEVGYGNVRFRFQSPHSNSEIRSNTDDSNHSNGCLSLKDENDLTLTLPVPSAKLGHQVISGDFNGDGTLDMAISAPYDGEEQTGTVFILNSTTTTTVNTSTNDIRDLATMMIQGKEKHGRFGWSMTTIDMNQDGIDDLAISTPFTTHGIVEVYFGQHTIGLGSLPNIQIQFESQEPLSTVLAGIDVDHTGFKDLVIGCPLCSVENRPQVGVVYVFKSRHLCTTRKMQDIQQFTQPDIIFRNPNLDPYDHFGESILQVEDTILIGAPGYSTESLQRVGRVYAFDFTGKLKWFVTGTSEFQQYGRVLATNKNHDIVAISSPSEENMVLLKKYWQGGTVRLYHWDVLNEGKDDIEHGILSTIKGRTNAGHLGQSISFFEQEQDLGIWIGEPMSEQENGRVYKWMLNNRHDLQCIRNNQVVLARFGSQIGLLGTDAICITSQRYGQNARHSGAVTFLRR